ncbi:carbohydrate ABC transporter permease [Phycicoccus duodecadis]|jgi:alpha-glucoside transport system permease protein|uniref:Carbohydrate ABC transporter membrane protein 2 (CUT1 family) n=1 Tax=Phycicoccus duodecadis TaxID=173053 RepID=A0A2N3YFE3_9MICO|nr:carbohydrate ABC transporter permease [Phycicoccus duodecadis]PKW25565.1 carbohydrate ABC transporter membrane protein 2 (CUT1 family) [Phycicoccus duodecadis]
MSTATPPPVSGAVADVAIGEAAREDALPTKRRRGSAAGNAARSVTSPWASVIAIVMALAWTTPTFGLLVTSFRKQGDIQATGWWQALSTPFTLSNYSAVLSGAEGQPPLTDFIVNSFVIAIPAVMLPLFLASLAAYAFAWIDFPFRNLLFVAVFALQIVPLQIALLPLVTMFQNIGIGGTYWSLWLSHSAFALPLAVFLLHNFMKEIPASLLEAARVDGAGHVRIFFQVLLPLITPALASFGIFQFLWVWNDLLVAITMLGGNAGNGSNAPLTMVLNNISGTLGNRWYLLSAAAFISIAVPVAVFLSLQRYFVRGLLAGGTKG